MSSQHKTMVSSVNVFVLFVSWFGAIAGLTTLSYAIVNMLIAQGRPSGQYTGAAKQILHTPILVIATILFLGLAYLLWKPLPFQLTWLAGTLLSISGGIILFPSLSLYVWGLRTLGTSFNASSGFGVRLNQAHKLVINGPYAYIRHPMYLAVVLACWGGLFLYRTWTMLIFAFMMCGLFYRAHKEEQALEMAFGPEWEIYRQSVPAWVPRLARKVKKDVV